MYWKKKEIVKNLEAEILQNNKKLPAQVHIYLFIYLFIYQYLIYTRLKTLQLQSCYQRGSCSL